MRKGGREGGREGGVSSERGGGVVRHVPVHQSTPCTGAARMEVSTGSSI